MRKCNVVLAEGLGKSWPSPPRGALLFCKSTISCNPFLQLPKPVPPPFPRKKIEA